MLTEVVEKASQITGGEDGWSGLRGYNKNRSQKAFLADKVIQLTETGNLKWLVSQSKDIVWTMTDDWMLIITRNTQPGGRYIGGTISNYQLVVFRGGLKDGQEVLSLNDRCDNNAYTTDYPRLPVMDMYDVATTGNVRKPRTAHVCGAQGFGQSLSDSCPACEGN